MSMTKEKLSNEELVSIIIPAYNSEQFIEETLSSVREQTYQNWEAIIVDDASIDNTRTVVEQIIKQDSRIKYYRLDNNAGAAVARNKGIKNAKGRYLAFLDSDDVWFSHKLYSQINFMQNNNYSFTCTSYTKINALGDTLNSRVKEKERKNYNDILKKNLGNSTVIYDTESLGKIFAPNIKKRNDYAMWLQVIKKAKILYGLDQPLGSHRVRKESLSSNKLSLIKYHWIVYRKIENLSSPYSFYLVGYWMVSTMMKIMSKKILSIYTSIKRRNNG